MARHATGWTIRLPESRTIWLVRFQHEGRTVERSTGEADRGRASERAAEIYAETITGRVALRPVSIDLVTSMAEWVADYETRHAGGTGDNAKGYVKSFLQFFGGFDRLTSSGYGEYMRTRIAQVSRSTLRKELSSSRQSRAWAETERGIVLPAVPGFAEARAPGGSWQACAAPTGHHPEPRRDRPHSAGHTTE